MVGQVRTYELGGLSVLGLFVVDDLRLVEREHLQLNGERSLDENV